MVFRDCAFNLLHLKSRQYNGKLTKIYFNLNAVYLSILIYILNAVDI